MTETDTTASVLTPLAAEDRLAAYAVAAEGAFAPSTLRAIRADTAVFLAWAGAVGEETALPHAPRLVAAFVDAMAETRRPATVSRYVASLNHLHRAAGLPPPGGAEVVRLALRRMRRAKGTRQDQAAPLGWDRVARILSTLGESLPDLRDAALLTVAYDTLARRAELAALDVGDVAPMADGTGTALIQRSKTDQEGAGSHRFLASSTMARIAAWTEAGGIVGGALFRPLGPAARRDRLDAGDIARIFRRRAIAAGIPEATKVSGHSTRIGAAQDALGHNLGTAAIQQAGGWKSARMVARYGERLEAGRSASARLAKFQGR